MSESNQTRDVMSYRWSEWRTRVQRKKWKPNALFQMEIESAEFSRWNSPAFHTDTSRWMQESPSWFFEGGFVCEETQWPSLGPAHWNLPRSTSFTHPPAGSPARPLFISITMKHLQWKSLHQWRRYFPHKLKISSKTVSSLSKSHRENGRAKRRCSTHTHAGVSGFCECTCRHTLLNRL